jgi:cysteine desulfurase/selenocysteine lyase
MSTSEIPGGGLDLAAMTGEIEKLANAMFAGPDLSGAFASPASMGPQAAPNPAPAGPALGASHEALATTAPASPDGLSSNHLAPAAPVTMGPQAAPNPAPPAAAAPVTMIGTPSHVAPAIADTTALAPPDPGGALYFLDLAPARQEPNLGAVSTALFTMGPQAAPNPAPPVAALPYEIHPELVPAVGGAPSLLDPYAVKRDFPILQERIRGKPLVWLDNAATTQKPRAVIDRISYFYEHENSNVHRAAHTLAARSTDAYEAARDKVRRFLNAPSSKEIVFVRGATEAINLVAQSWGRRNVREGDEIVVTHLEHHANIVPWQMLCAEKGAKLKVAPVDDRGQVILEEYERLLGPRTRLVAFTQVSNALGTITPAREMIAMAHRHGARVLLDGAQAVSHMPVDVQALDCDFYVLSGHKVFAPTGIGALFGKSDVLEQMPPWQGGGNMIADVTFERTVYQAAPSRFEAGTGNIADAVGLGAALDYVESLGRHNIDRHEHDLRVYAEGCLTTIPGVRIIGTAPEKAGVISFVIDGVRTEDVGGMLDQDGIAVRSGHHCAQPILRRFGLEATVRASLAPYNTREDVQALVAAVRRIQLGRGR